MNLIFIDLEMCSVKYNNYSTSFIFPFSDQQYRVENPTDMKAKMVRNYLKNNVNIIFDNGNYM